MARTKQTDEELQEASNHLQYEFSMLMSVAQVFASGIAAQDWLVNALLESFIIHFRALLDFFYPPVNAKKDDVLAGDYFDDSEAWEKIRPRLSEALSRAKTRAHKEIAHLTYGGAPRDAGNEGWAFIETANEMKNVMEIFLRDVP